MKGIYVLGTDTGVGKTLVSGMILRSLSQYIPLLYWKPVQTGSIEDDDTRFLKHIAALDEASFFEPTYRFSIPVSPHLAANQSQVRIKMEILKEAWEKVISINRFLVVEAAGGLMVPFGENFLQRDWILATGLTTILVIEDRLGAINHSLLTIEILRQYGIPLLGAVINKGPLGYGNRESIEEFGGIKVLGEIPKVMHPADWLRDESNIREWGDKLASLCVTDVKFQRRGQRFRPL